MELYHVAKSISDRFKLILPSYMLAYIRGTTTTTGLKVTARLDEGVYRKGLKVSRKDMDLLKLRKHDTCPALNYTISPRNEGEVPSSTPSGDGAPCPT